MKIEQTPGGIEISDGVNTIFLTHSEAYAALEELYLMRDTLYQASKHASAQSFLARDEIVTWREVWHEDKESTGE